MATTFGEFTFTAGRADSHSSLDSHTISTVLGAVARTLQIAAIVCAAFLLGSLPERDITQKLAQLISRLRHPRAID
jgi:hypothetical protein